MNQSNQKQVENPRFESFAGSSLVVSTTQPLPPGSRVTIGLPLKDDSEMQLAGKVLSLTPSGDGFTLKVRLHSVTKKEEAILNSFLS